MKLIFFTGTYPYGVGEQWKKNELDEFVKHFDDITVVPFSPGNNFDNPKRLPDGVKLAQPLFMNEGMILGKSDFLKIVFHKHGYIFLKEFFAKRVYTNKARIINWMQTTLNIIRLLAHPLIKEIQQAPSESILYFFWGKGTSDILPFIDTKSFKKIVVRMHRFDLFEYTNHNYIPYRKQLMSKNEVLIAPCSDTGKAHLLELYPLAKNHIRTIRLGTTSNGRKSKMSADGVLRIISCSNLVPVKRVKLMIESLQYINVPVLWRHIGDGPLKDELVKLVSDLKLSDKFIFEGFVNTELINSLYTDSVFDLFVNTSASEGVPVSIMEAFAAGIPVLATDVGGTAEIVDETVGGILSENISPKELAEKILQYYHLHEERKYAIRENAYNRFLQKSDAIVLRKELVDILKN